jgi:glycosyltransferase involved in cell wall biosynthesis
MAAPVVLLTPNLTGHDGISAVARLVAGTFDQVSVLALHERRDLTTFAGATVQGAGGAAPRFALAALRAAARFSRATVIVNHVHLAPAALAFTVRGGTLVSILHGVEAWTPLTWPQRAALTRSDHLIAVSAFSRDRFRAANPQFAARHVDVCHHGVGPAAVPDTPSDQTPAALIVGRMTAGERYKGHDALIEIWPAVLDAVPGAVLRIVGDGDDRRRLEQKAAAMGLGGQVVFLEAMRAARSCIGCRGAASEIIDDGDTGWIVEPGDRHRLTERVIRTLRDRSESAAMGARGRARYLQHFTEAHFRQRLTELLPTETAD